MTMLDDDAGFRRMRILMAAKFVPSGHRPMGGVQSWIQTVEDELVRRGHTVEQWQPGFRGPQGRFHLGILANMPLTGNMAHLCNLVINVSHGIIEPEQPRICDWTFYVSEGVRDHWKLPNGSILRQPIDLSFWKPAATPVPRRYATRFSYRNSKTLCDRAARQLRMPYLHLSDASPEHARRILQMSHLVFASGRAALEAMACGANVLIYDHRSAYQGPLLDTDLQRQMQNSYSGRGGIEEPSLQDIIEAVLAVVSGGRKWVQEHHDVSKIVDQMLEGLSA